MRCETLKKKFITPIIELTETKLESVKTLLENGKESSLINRSIKSIVWASQSSSGLSGDQEAVLHRRSSIDAITLLEKLPSKVCADDGSTTLDWWTWTVRIRTIAMTPFQCVLTGISEEPIYQQIAEKALHLKELGLSNYRIAELLNVNDKTVPKALKCIND